jgi:hypothetical protein
MRTATVVVTLPVCLQATLETFVYIGSGLAKALGNSANRASMTPTAVRSPALPFASLTTTVSADAAIFRSRRCARRARIVPSLRAENPPSASMTRLRSSTNVATSSLTSISVVETSRRRVGKDKHFASVGISSRRELHVPFVQQQSRFGCSAIAGAEADATTDKRNCPCICRQLRAIAFPGASIGG